MQAMGKGNSGDTCAWQMQSMSLPHCQEGARVAGVTVNTGCCDQAGFLPLAMLFTSITTHQCPTAHKSNYSFTSLTHPLHYAPLPPSTGYCHIQGHPSREIFLHTDKGHQAEACSTYSHRDRFKLVDSQLEKPKELMALTFLTHQKLPPRTQCESLLCHFTL